MNEQENANRSYETVNDVAMEDRNNIREDLGIKTDENNQPGKYNLGPIEEPVIKRNNVMLVMLLVVAILIILGAAVGMFVKSWTDGKIKTPEEFKGETIEQTDNKKEENKESVVDPYENFRNLTWSTKQSNAFSIKDNSIYYEEEVLLLDIDGIYKSIEVVSQKNMYTVYLLTEEGIAWKFNVYIQDEIEIEEVKQILNDIKIADMTYKDTNTNESIYFLTELGELVDCNNNSYDKYSFIGAVPLFSGSSMSRIPYDENNYLYHWDGKEYVQITNKSKQKIAAEKVILMSPTVVLIYTSHGYIYKYNMETNIASQTAKNVKSIAFYRFEKEDSYNMIITYTSGPKSVEYVVGSVYDMNNGTTLDVEDFKTFDSYKNHKNVKWATSNASVGAGENYRSIYCENDDTAYLVIGNPYTDVKQLTLIEGTPIKAHIYRTYNAMFDKEMTEAYILTEEGKAYEVNSENGVTSELTNLSKYNIIDMACMGDDFKMMVFLTDAGDLLTYNGNLYE